MSLKMQRASVVQKAERLNRARLLLLEGVPDADVVGRLGKEFSLSQRQAYRYLKQAHQLKEPVSRGEEKLAFTVKLPKSLMRVHPRPEGCPTERISDNKVIRQ